MLSSIGCELIDMGVIPDNPEKIQLAFDEASNIADVVITSGGVSVGEADYVKEIFPVKPLFSRLPFFTVRSCPSLISSSF